MILLLKEIEVNVFRVTCMYVEIEINLEKFSDLIIHINRSECIPSPVCIQKMKSNQQKFSDLIIYRNKSEGIPSPLYVYRK